MRSCLVLALALAACGGSTAAAPPSPPAKAAPAPVAAAPAPPPKPAFDYPSARRDSTVDDYHGTKVADPYRWMEDVDSPETKAWVEAENKLTFDYLAKLPGRQKLKDRLTELWNYERYTNPIHKGASYFYTKNSGLQNQAVLYVAPKLDAEPRLLIDPNQLSTDGTVALHDFDVSHDGKLLLFGIADAGSDWVEYHVMRVADGKELPDHVKWNKFGGASWDRAGKGFYYDRFEAPKEGMLKGENRFPKVYYHRLGTAQDKDELVYERSDQPNWSFRLYETDDGRWLVLAVSTSDNDKNLLFVRDAKNKKAAWIPIDEKFEARLTPIDTVGTKLYLKSDKGAPRFHVVTVDIAKPTAPWVEVIPEAQGTLQQVTLVNDQLVARYLEDAHSKVEIHDRAGKTLRELQLPGIGTAAGFAGERGDKETFYSYTSYATPLTIFRYDLVKGDSTLFKQPKLPFDATQFETAQVFFKSKDGTRVPIFITHRKGIQENGQNPTLMYGYGGFDIPETPRFSVPTIAWLEAGGVYADVVLRGGGEYGEAWHEAAMREKKQNVFDDYIGAAEFLIADKLTSPQKLAISGGSNGGLLVGAFETQRPDLIACALPAVGVMDMLRFQKFTIGWSWASEYGSSDDADVFPAILAYSPLHNVKPGTRYPATLVTTADHDDRVFPAHSFKFTAAMQAAQAGPAPVMIRIETRAGHGMGKPTSKLIDEAADRLAFAAHALGMSI